MCFTFKQFAYSLIPYWRRLVSHSPLYFYYVSISYLLIAILPFPCYNAKSLQSAQEIQFQQIVSFACWCEAGEGWKRLLFSLSIVSRRESENFKFFLERTSWIHSLDRKKNCYSLIKDQSFCFEFFKADIVGKSGWHSCEEVQKV